MLQLEGNVFVGNKRMGSYTVIVSDDERLPFSKRLDTALLSLCKSMNVPLPVWLKKNSREFARFRQTIFFPDQFTSTVPFDQFQIRFFDEED